MLSRHQKGTIPHGSPAGSTDDVCCCPPAGGRFDPFYGVLIVLTEKDWANRVYDGSPVMGNIMPAALGLGIGSEREGNGHCAVGSRDGEPPKAAPRKDGRVLWVE